MKQPFEKDFAEHAKLFEKISTSESLKTNIEKCASVICHCLQCGGKLLLCGNGGSAADAMHITAEFAGKFYRPKEPLAAVCLNANVSVITAVANDTHYRYVFSKQVEALAYEGDVLIALTTSGKSANVLEVLKTAKKAGAITITLCGEDVSEVVSDYVIAVPSCDTPRIQEAHMFIGHYFAHCAEEFFLNGENNE